MLVLVKDLLEELLTHEFPEMEKDVLPIMVIILPEKIIGVYANLPQTTLYGILMWHEPKIAVTTKLSSVNNKQLLPSDVSMVINTLADKIEGALRLLNIPTDIAKAN